ncbi:unnamed protein product [Ectocarpus sp. 6 AP-2014]
MMTERISPPATSKLFINNKWHDAGGGATFECLNPATEELICSCANAQAEDVDKAVAAARACFEGPNWGFKSTGAQRAACLRAMGKAIEDDKDAFARLESENCGKPIKESVDDMDQAVEALRFYADLAEKLGAEEPEEIAVPDDSFRTRVVREPIGVIGAITPWNYPLLMAVQKVAPALAAGCTVVLKPSELAPLTCARMATLAEAAGLPAGALNVLTGEGSPAGASLSAHRGVDKVSFTGSVPTGQKVMAAAAGGPAGVHLELGGKGAMIVFDDIEDIDATVDWICMGIFFNSGQVCSATSRLLLHSKIHDKVVAKILERAASVTVGGPLRGDDKEAEGTCMGPLVSGPQRDKVLGFVSRAVDAGAKVLCGGGPPPDADAASTDRKPGKGYYVSPTVLTGVKETDEAWTAEIFGPVLCIRQFEEEDEALAAANDSEFGLAASVMSADKDRCERVARALRVGIVWQNCSQPAFIQAPWGGYKKSGFGRELGRWGLEAFLGVKQITSCAGSFSYEWYGK